MPLQHDVASVRPEHYLTDLLESGLLIPAGVPGVYGLSGVFESVVEHFEAYVTRMGAHLGPEVMRFPPVFSRATYLRTNHLETFPNLMGSVHSFLGNSHDHHELSRKAEAGEDWTSALRPTDVMLVPAACYPLYPTATGSLAACGRTVDLRAFVFRHEPSLDPARLQAFRQREYVRLGSPRQAVDHRDYWLERAQRMLREVGLYVQPVVANDPFFGDTSRLMVATQREQALKYELVVPIGRADSATAITSCNYHVDHFGSAFDIRTPDGRPAHSACVGFGLERITLALLKTHGFKPDAWPVSVRKVLDL